MEKLFHSFCTETDCKKRKVLFDTLSHKMIKENVDWHYVSEQPYGRNYFKDHLQKLAFNWQTFKMDPHTKDKHKIALADFLKEKKLTVGDLKKEDYCCCFPAIDFKELASFLSQQKGSVLTA